jgi:uncharacterized protein YbjT (DUF2867 family)
MILVTGASGKTGRAILQAIAGRGAAARALVRREGQIEAARAAGASEAIVGDMRDEAVWGRAMAGVRAVYHICPNMTPDEERIGGLAIGAARGARVQRFVYHSVLHPQTEAMPHHWNKLKVEEDLLESGLSFAILQPTAYMQNLLGYWAEIIEHGVLRIPYPAETRISLIDLDDVAEAAATVLTELGHAGATYELVGAPALSQAEVAEVLSQNLGRSVRVEVQSVAEWETRARTSGLGEYQRETLIKMFHYYARYGLAGNPKVLGWLLGRPPTTLGEFVLWTARGQAPRSRRPRYCEG